MPEIGANGGIQRGARLPVIPQPHADPAGIGASLAHVGAAVGATVARGVHVGATGGSDAATSGPGYGSARANAYKATPQYRQAVEKVFLAQPLAQKGAILTHVLRTPSAHWTPEIRAIRDAWHHGMGVDEQVALAHYLPHPGGIDVGRALDGIYHSLLPESVDYRQQATGRPNLTGQSIVGEASKLATGLIQKLPVKTQQDYTTGGQIANRAGFGQDQILKNAAKDAANFYIEALPSVGIPVSDALQGHVGRAVQDVVGQYGQIFHDPQQAFINHPFLSTMAFMAPLHLGTRGIAGGIRAAAPASAAGRALGLERPGVQLTGNLTHEQPPYSPYPLIQMSQKSIEKSRFARNARGETAPRSESQRKLLIRRGVAEMFSGRELIRRSNREGVRSLREAAIRPTKAQRAAHAAKTTFTYDPRRASIPGGEVFQRVNDRTIRRADTFVQDLIKHRADVAATRPDLSGRLLREHDAYVKVLDKLISKPPKDLGPLFRASDQFARDYPVTEAEAHALGHFGDRPAEALQRRALMHYARTHIPGVEFHDELGMTRKAPKAEVRAAVQRVRAQIRTLEQRVETPATDRGEAQQMVAAHNKIAELRGQLRAMWDNQVVPLPTREILDHLNGPEGTGGRMPVFTSDAPRSGSAYYVSGERRPTPQLKRNTLWAYEHGLTEPGHEGATEQHVKLQGIVDAHRSQNEYLNTLVHGRELAGGKGFWNSYASAKADAPEGYVPINLAQPFHPTTSLDKALEGLDPATIEEEATRRGLDLSERMREETGGNRWGLIDQFAVKALREQQGAISPNTFLRAVRGLNTQFREVVLSTSTKHLPGVATENLIRDISYGIAFRSWFAGGKIFDRAEAIDPVLGREARARAKGGQLAGMTDFGKTHSVAANWEGTTLYHPIKAMESFFKAPGPRQLRTAWKAYSHFVIQGTKHYMEEQHNRAAVGKLALKQHGYGDAYRINGILGVAQRMLGLHGQMLDDAARGILDPRKQRQYRAYSRQVYGNWTDLTPTGKTMLMFSPFGMWWINSVRYLARMPVDQPVKAGLLASATAGTQKERAAVGLDPFAPNALPLYKQGGMPIGGKVWGQNYYMPQGVANDPGNTGGSLIEPWLMGWVQAMVGKNWRWENMTSPDHPNGNSSPNILDRLQALAESTANSFGPLYTKAKTVLEGGAPAYDLSPQWPLPALKGPNGGIGAGLKKALFPARLAPGQSSSSGPGGVNVPTINVPTVNVPTINVPTINLPGG